MASKIILSDNSKNVQLVSFYRNNIDGMRHDVDVISREIANRSINDIIESNPNVLIFPDSLSFSKDKIGDQCIFSITDAADVSKVEVSTGNILGFIGIDGIQINLKSRFDSSQKDYFLHYMLQRVCNFNIFDYETVMSKDRYFDFLIYLFPYFLKKAMTQGIYKEYKTFWFNDCNVRGVLDVDRHIAYDCPFIGNIAYHTRSYSYDNDVTQLIRHTIEYIRSCENLRCLFDNSEMNSCIQRIYQVTSTYRRQDRSKILSKSIKRLRTSYFIKYIPLQRLCSIILMHEKMKYNSDNRRAYGILFDGAWLWEEYLNTIISKCQGFSHPQNKLARGGDSLFVDGGCKIYPDFIKKVNEINKTVIADAKYKRLDKNRDDYERMDYYQLLSYMYRYQSIQGYLIYPTTGEEKYKRREIRTISGKRFLTEYGMKIFEESDSFSTFVDNMRDEELKLKEELESI